MEKKIPEHVSLAELKNNRVYKATHVVRHDHEIVVKMADNTFLISPYRNGRGRFYPVNLQAYPWQKGVLKALSLLGLVPKSKVEAMVRAEEKKRDRKIREYDRACAAESLAKYGVKLTAEQTKAIKTAKKRDPNEQW